MTLVVEVRKVPSTPICLPGLFALRLDLAITSKNSLRSRGSPPEPEKKDGESISFLGRRITQAEYEEICRNLQEFFDLLSKWKKEGEQT